MLLSYSCSRDLSSVITPTFEGLQSPPLALERLRALVVDLPRMTELPRVERPIRRHPAHQAFIDPHDPRRLLDCNPRLHYMRPQ